MTVSKAALASYLQAGRAGKKIARRPQGVPVPLSFGQEQIWLHGLLAPELPLYNETVTVHYKSQLKVEALHQALNEIVRRHEAWRSTIDLQDGAPRQQVHGPAPVPFRNIDLQSLAPGQREPEAIRLATESATRLFDLSRGPLLRALVVTLAEDDHRLFLTLHHFIFDGVSIRNVLLPELAQLYESFSQGWPSPLPEPELQYGDYTWWQRQQPAESREPAIAYWKTQLAELPPLSLPTDRPRTPDTGLRGEVRLFDFGPALTAALKECGARERATLFSMLLTSFAVLLGRYCGEEDIAIGTISAGRTHSEFETILGYFLNTVVLRTDLSGNPSFRELLARVREVTLSALCHADVPFQEIVRELHPTRDGRNPIFQVMFSLEPPLGDLFPGWDLSEFDVQTGTAKVDLHIELDEKADRVIGRMIYNSALFDGTTIDRLIGHWVTLLNGVVADPGRRIAELPLLEAAEERWLTEDVNRTGASYPSQTLPELFARQAAATPDAVAVSFAGRRLSYRELDQRSNQLAHYLQAHGIAPGSVVAVLVPRSPQMLIALLAILKAGAAYVPLDPTYPAARLAAMLDRSAADLLVTEVSSMGRVGSQPMPILLLDAKRDEIARQPQTAADYGRIRAEQAAYIIFTSGSTGQPKGVEVPHRALVNLLWSMKREPGIAGTDVLLAVTSICFDIAALELFLPLISGARIELASRDEAADPSLLAARLSRSGATVMQATPVTWRMLIEAGWRGSPSLKVLCGGEALTQNLAADLLPRCGQLWNMYGPTETTIWSTCCRVLSAARPIPLGAPIANTTLYVLDAQRSLVPVGVPGELYIGGDGLANGYWRRPDLTADRFPLVALGGDRAVRLYRTGDRVRRHPDGSLEFFGRLDRQVKIRGYRIELGEIEHVLRSHPTVQEGIALKSQGEGGDELLVAYVIPRAGAHRSDRSGSPAEIGELRTYLEQRLPAFMQPSALCILDSVPLTPNGKLDRNRLPHPVPQARAVSEAPLEGTERELAEIWCELLHASQVGRHDNFFDLGGHSLLAARLVARISRRYNRRITLGNLVQAPTIAQIAPLLHGHSAPNTTMLKGSSSAKKQLLWIGADPWLRRLASHLGQDQAIYSLTLNQDDFAPLAPGYRMEGVAKLMLRHIRELQPEGPYLLGGFCMSALLAYECAQQLRQTGDEIALLILGDVYPPGRAPRCSPMDRVRRRLEREVFHLAVMRRCSPLQWRAYLRRRVDGFLLDLDRRKWQSRRMRERPGKEVAKELYQALWVAQMNYQVAPYPGKVLFLESGGQQSEPHLGTAPSWDGLILDGEVFESPGDHTSIFEEPYVSLAAEQIQAALDTAVSAPNPAATFSLS